MSIPLDCVVVGYNDISFSDMLDRTEVYKEVSGGYRHLLVNSAPFRGKRVRYAELLNVAIEAATGNPSRLHVAKLPNLGVCYLVSFLRRRSYRTEFINFYNEETDRFCELLKDRPRSVAITTTFYFEPESIKEIVAFVRKYSPETKVIVGGPHIFNICSDNAPSLQDILLRDMGADIYIFDSQGEATLAKLCGAFREENPNLSAIPNLIYTADRNTFQRSLRQPEANNMDNEAVDWSLFEPDFLAPTVQLRTARSCAFKCAFCRYPVMAGALDLTSLEVVERELKHLHSVGVKQLMFIDDTFNVPLKRFKELCRMMISNKFGFDWFSYFRCSNSDAEAFDLLAESGCKGVFLGIESGDDRVLRAMNKAATVDKYAQGIDHLNRHGIITYASFIIGHPGETEDTVKNTLAFINDTGPMFYCLESFFYDPKVPIASRALDFGLSGTGYAWKHNTMDWERASELVEEGYRTISNSIILPLYGFDLWSIAYLLGQGMSLDQIRRFLGGASKLLPYPANDERTYALERELIDVFHTANQGLVN
jgi:radical SAM PhpK family P-methyltransferase